MNAIASSSTYLIAPNIGLIVWTIIVLCAFVMGAATLAKGRWGWFVIGLLTGGLAWLVSGFLEPTPGSLWSRLFRGSHVGSKS